MASPRAVHGLLLASLILLLASQAAFLLGPVPGAGWEVGPLLYALVPSLVLSLVAERFPLPLRAGSAGAVALAAAALAALYAILVGASWAWGCWACSGIGPGSASALAALGALAVGIAGGLALGMKARPAPAQPRTFALTPARPAAAPRPSGAARPQPPRPALPGAAPRPPTRAAPPAAVRR